MWLSCYGERVCLDNGLVYTDIEIFQKCIEIRTARSGNTSLEFNAQLNFEHGASVPVPFAHILLVCNILSRHHNDRVAAKLRTPS
jgi:hypothetical protein